MVIWKMRLQSVSQKKHRPTLRGSVGLISRLPGEVGKSQPWTETPVRDNICHVKVCKSDGYP